MTRHKRYILSKRIVTPPRCEALLLSSEEGREEKGITTPQRSNESIQRVASVGAGSLR